MGLTAQITDKMAGLSPASLCLFVSLFFFASCDAVQFILDGYGNQIRHQFSDTVYVKPFQTSTCIGLHDIVRPIVLWPEVIMMIYGMQKCDKLILNKRRRKVIFC